MVAMNNENHPMTSDGSMLERERISALVDGQLAEPEFSTTVQAMRGRAELLETWRVYHLSGEVLRASQPLTALDSTAFVARLRGRLQPLSPEPVDRLIDASTQDSPLVVTRSAANDGQFRWKMAAGLASLAAVLAVFWGMTERAGQTDAQLARTSAAAPGVQAAADVQVPGVLIRDARLDELLAAHKQFGSSSALQTPAGFLRNATLETSSPSR